VTTGVYWRNNPFTSGKSERFVPWSDFVTLQIQPRGKHIIEIGSGDLFSLASSDLTPARLADMLEDLCIAYHGQPPNKQIGRNRRKTSTDGGSSHFEGASPGAPNLTGDGTAQSTEQEAPSSKDVLAVLRKYARPEHSELFSGRKANANAPATWHVRVPLTAFVRTTLPGPAIVTVGVSERGVFIAATDAPETSFLSWEDFAQTPIKYQADGLYVGDVVLVSNWRRVSAPSDAGGALRDVLQLLRSLQALRER